MSNNNYELSDRAKDFLKKIAKQHPLDEAKEALAEHDKLKLMDKLHDCQHAKWERMLRNLVKHIDSRGGY